MDRGYGSHVNHHWCPACRQWILKEDAIETTNYGKLCPQCKKKGRTVRLRTSSRCSKKRQGAAFQEWRVSEPINPVEAED